MESAQKTIAANLNLQPINVIAVQSQGQPVVVQPKTDLGKSLIITITGDGVETIFPLSSEYLDYYGAMVFDGVSIQNTAGAGSLDNLKGLSFSRPRIDGADNTNVSFVDLTQYTPTELSNNKKMFAPIKGLISTLSTVGNPNYSKVSLHFKTAPAVGEKWTLTFNIVEIVGQRQVI